MTKKHRAFTGMRRKNVENILKYLSATYFVINRHIFARFRTVHIAFTLTIWTHQLGH